MYCHLIGSDQTVLPDDGDDDNDIDYDNLAEDDASLDNYDNGNAYGCDQPAPSA